MIKLLVGLGNPGREYLGTRHNKGFHFLDCIASDYKLKWKKEKQFHAETAFLSLAGGKILLAKPQTYMNNSGLSVGAISKFYKFELNEILVVHDELDLLPGIIRLKQGGSTSGHNGLKSINKALGGLDFMRLRIGVGHPRDISDHARQSFHNDVSNYVLSVPDLLSESRIEATIQNALSNLKIILDDMYLAMQFFNKKNR